MAFLESLASGLRGAGSVLSQDVYQNNLQDDRARQQELERRRTMVAQQVIRSAESGAMPPGAAQETLRKLGYGELPVGLSAEGQARQDAMKQRQEMAQRQALLREDLANLPEEDRSNPAVLANRFTKHGFYEIGAKYADTAAARLDRMQQFITEQQRRAEELRAKSEDRALDRASREELARQGNELRAQIATGQQAIQRESMLLRRQMGEGQRALTLTDDGSGNKVWVDPRNPTAPAIPAMGPAGETLKSKSTEKALPVSAAQKLIENQQNLRRAEQALALVRGEDIKNEKGEIIAKGDKNATGAKNYLFDALVQRIDPKGVDTRAAIGDLGSLIIHDRSGAAVTAAEFPRLRPFIPMPTDDRKTAEKKLLRFTEEYRKQVSETSDFFKESGYKVPTETLRPSGATGRPPLSSFEGK